MCLAKIVFAALVYTTLITNILVSGDDVLETEPPEEKTEPPPLENHSFVALIDILFTDGSQRTCTGTIIHDNAVITAAHCFLNNGPEYVDVEMSGSFVVIGTRTMFDTGYENYLPIERIITHPRYRGWTADLALVFTLAGMVTDKPGNAIPLIGEKAPTPVDSNVTILSWGRCMNEEETGTKFPVEKKRKCTSSEENRDSCETFRVHKAARSGSIEETNLSSSGQVRSHLEDKPHSAQATTVNSATKKVPKLSQRTNTEESTEHKEAKLPKEAKVPKKAKMPKESNESIESDESIKPKESKEHGGSGVTIGMESRNLSVATHNLRSAESKKKDNVTRLSREQPHLKPYRKSSIFNFKDNSIKSYNKNLRRKAKPNRPKENKLTVEPFGFVNVQTCKKIIDKAMPPQFAINTNEVVCYAAEEHYISDDDSGAPAVRQGQLVAVTVGGAQCDGDHVAIGMKMNCFCSWIVENLPEKNLDWNCCKDCCSSGEPLKPRKHRSRS